MQQKLDELDLVLFGATGDLVMRKLMPAMYGLHRHGYLPKTLRIYGLARSTLSKDEYVAIAQKSCERFIKEPFDAAAWKTFADRIEYRSADLTDSASYNGLRTMLGDTPDRARVYYLSTAPNLFIVICQNLAQAHLINEHARVVLEKPLGHDLASSRTINDEVGSYFSEQQIFRIDHYLGKEAVQNLLALRFGNTLFEPLWRREWIRDVQITVAEKIGVENRGEFYDKTGAARDMVQNHLLQLLCITAMEPPANISPDAVRDEKLKVLRALRHIRGADVTANTVRGQYRAGAVDGKPVPGYLDEPGISPDSKTETFVALKTQIETWRWAGVPFFLRTGKRMQERLAEIVINFRDVPHSIFALPSGMHGHNQMVIRMQPDETVQLQLMAKQPGDVMRLERVSLSLDFTETFHKRRLEAYERLLMDAMRGNLTLFVRRDEQEAAWRWLEPILDAWRASPDGPKPYTAGTWGPAASSALVAREGYSWHEES